MNTSRIVRGTKARIFIYILAVLIVTGIIACYNNTLSQLEEAKKSSEICHQQEENLSTQLQVISDYKQRLEKSLKTEKVEHQQTKTELENKLKDEKTRNDKTASEVNLRLSSLQQHSNMLQTQFDDFKEKCSKTQKKQLDEINDLQSKLKEVQEELKKVESAKENLKSQLAQLQIDNEKQAKERNALLKEIQTSHDNGKNVLIPSQRSSTENNREDLREKNVGPQPPGYQDQAGAANNLSTKSTTSPSAIHKPSVGSLDRAAPIVMPTVTPEKPPSDNNGAEQKAALPLPYQIQKFPDGVVPVPDFDDTNSNIKKTDDENKGPNERNNENVNNRYQNKIVESNADEQKAEDKENGAHEEFDQPGQNNAFEAFGFEDQGRNQGDIKNFEKNHIDNLAIGKEKIEDGRDFNENEVPMENELDGDDDVDDYNDHMGGQQKDAVVRH